MKRHRRIRGFTLIELIASLVLTGFVASIMLVFLSDTLRLSHGPRESMQEAYRIRTVMERIVAEYTGDPNLLMAAVGPEGSVQNNAFGTYRVEYNRFVVFNPSGTQHNDDGSRRLIRISVRSTQTAEYITHLFPF